MNSTDEKNNGYVVIDLEMCKVPKSRRTKEFPWCQETIQIGAVYMDADFHVLDRFDTFVKPELGFLEGFIRGLTHITDEDIADAPGMKEALRMFAEWYPKGAVCVSWSMSDRAQIMHEMEGKDIHFEAIERLFGGWIDCQEEFSGKIGETRIYKLSEALIMADIPYDENIHNGLADAYNTALLYAKLQREPELILNRYYAEARNENVVHIGTGLGSLLKGLDLTGFAQPA